MCYGEFLNILNAGNFITDEFTERDAISCFAQSMMIQVDEFDSDRHMRMQKVEFYEAIARAAECLSFPPDCYLIEEWTLEKRQTQSLSKKMENLIPSLIKAAKKEFRERFKRPLKDQKTDLYIIPN